MHKLIELLQSYASMVVCRKLHLLLSHKMKLKQITYLVYYMDFGNYTLFDVGAIVWCRIAILSKFYYARDSYSERMLYSIDISLYIARNMC